MKKIYKETKITIIYILIGLGWIFFSDSFLNLFVREKHLLTKYQSFKGIIYVLITGYLLYLILHRTFKNLRKQREQLLASSRKLHKQRDFLCNIIDLVPHLIFAKNKNGDFLMANKAVAELYNTNPRDLVGINHYDLHRKISEQEVRQIKDTDSKIYKKNVSLEIAEEKVTGINGETGVYQTKKIPLVTPEEEQAILGVAVDITQLKQNEKQLAEQKRELQKNYEQLEADNEEFLALNQELERSFKEIKRYHQIEEKFQQELIIAITQFLELHDTYTEGHSKAVAGLALKLAGEMGLSRKEKEKTYWAGMVHDIGKILIPELILNKKAALNCKEKEMIAKHPYWGYKALKESNRLRELAEIILYHHERWDGKGYPEGLKRDDIPLISQILCVADSWHAMRSNRPYRSAMTEELALEELKVNKGSQFSPLVVEAFYRLHKKNQNENTRSAGL